MLLIKALTPLLVIMALLLPIIIAYRRGSLDTSVNYGWLLVTWAALSIDLIVPMIGFRFYGYPALAETAPENPLALKAAFFGWPIPFVLHFIGGLIRKLLSPSTPCPGDGVPANHLPQP
jgi:hypothetical protein